MNIQRYETTIHKKADQAHAHVQQSGYASDYVIAAQLYEKCGDYGLARVCREAAERLAK